MPRLLQASILFGTLVLPLPAHALDCTSADVKKDAAAAAICADPGLMQADQKMNDAYQSLVKGRDKQQQRVIKRMQAAWLRDERNDACQEDGSECLALIRHRTTFLGGADGIGPASQGRLIFKGYYASPKKPGDLAADISVYEFETADKPGKKAFNAEVEKLLSDAMRMPGYDECHDCTILLRMSTPFQAGRFISAEADYSESEGGARPESFTTNLNYDIEQDHPVQFSMLFVEYDAPVLAKPCYVDATSGSVSLNAASVGDSEERERPSNVFMDIFLDLKNWKFDGKSAKVDFGINTLGDYTAGSPECTLSYDLLKQHLTSDATLPVADDEAARHGEPPQKPQ